MRALPAVMPDKAALAQLVEHRIRNAGVVGSNPIGGTIFPKATKATGRRILSVSLVVLCRSSTIFIMPNVPVRFVGLTGAAGLTVSNSASCDAKPVRPRHRAARP